MTVPISNEDSIMRDITQPKGLRITRVVPLDMDVPNSRRDVTRMGPQFETNVRWLPRNLAVRNKNHPEFEKTMKTLKSLAKRMAREI